VHYDRVSHNAARSEALRPAIDQVVMSDDAARSKT